MASRLSASIPPFGRLPRENANGPAIDRCPKRVLRHWGLVGPQCAWYRDWYTGGGEMITITITSGMLLAFFWAFWIFAFAGWWCGGGC